MKKTVGATLLALLLLAGCSGSADEAEPPQVADYLYVQTVELPDGRQVDCVLYANRHQGGLSCDWAGAK